jgi:hypothetical protein
VTPGADRRRREARSAGTGTPGEIAARAIAVGILANTLLKLTIVLIVGRRPFVVRAAAPLAAMAIALAALTLG